MIAGLRLNRVLCADEKACRELASWYAENKKAEIFSMGVYDYDRPVRKSRGRRNHPKWYFTYRNAKPTRTNWKFWLVRTNIAEALFEPRKRITPESLNMTSEQLYERIDEVNDSLSHRGYVLEYEFDEIV